MRAIPRCHIDNVNKINARTCLRKPRAISISSVVDCLRMIGVRCEAAGATARPAGDGSREEHDDEDSGDLDDWQLRTL